jgi:hypothetical protein
MTVRTWWIDFTIRTGQRNHSADLCIAIEDKLNVNLPDSSVGNTPEGDLSVSVYVTDHTDLLSALHVAYHEVGGIVFGQGLEYDVTAVDTCTEEDLERRNAEPNYPELVSGPEAAAILNVNRQRVHQLAHDNPNFPEPLYRLGVGSLWTRRSIEAFAERWERKPGRPAKHAS